MNRRTILSSIIAIAVGVLASCDKASSLIPKEVSSLEGVLKGATEKLTSITGADPASAVQKAQEALPDLQTVGAQLGSVSGLMDKLPGPAKTIVAKVIGQFGDQIISLLEKAKGIPGVGDKIGAVATTIADHINKLKAAK